MTLIPNSSEQLPPLLDDRYRFISTWCFCTINMRIPWVSLHLFYAPFLFCIQVLAFLDLFRIKKAQELEKGAGTFQPRYHWVSCPITLRNRCNHINPCKDIGSTGAWKKRPSGLQTMVAFPIHLKWFVAITSKDSQHPKWVEKGWIGWWCPSKHSKHIFWEKKAQD